jgi:hypothetical protein
MSAEQSPHSHDFSSQLPEGFVICGPIPRKDYPHGLTLKLATRPEVWASTDGHDHSGTLRGDIVIGTGIILDDITENGERCTVMKTSKVVAIVQDTNSGKRYVITGNRKSVYELVPREVPDLPPAPQEEVRTTRSIASNRLAIAGVFGVGLAAAGSYVAVDEYMQSRELQQQIGTASPLTLEHIRNNAKAFNDRSWLFDVDTSAPNVP